MRDFNEWRKQQLDVIAEQHMQLTLLDAWEVGCVGGSAASFAWSPNVTRPDFVSLCV